MTDVCVFLAERRRRKRRRRRRVGRGENK